MVKLIKDATIGELVEMCQNTIDCRRCPLRIKSLTQVCFVSSLRYDMKYGSYENKDILNKKIKLSEYNNKGEQCN